MLLLLASTSLVACTPPQLARADLFGLTNAERQARHLPALAWSPTLADYARTWARTMALSHNLRHSDASALFAEFDYVGENIGDGNASAGAMSAAFMHSPVHRDNVVAPGFTQIGIGVYCAGPVLWIAVEFARPWAAGPPPHYAGGSRASPIVSHADQFHC